MHASAKHESMAFSLFLSRSTPLLVDPHRFDYDAVMNFLGGKKLGLDKSNAHGFTSCGNANVAGPTSNSESKHGKFNGAGKLVIQLLLGD